jgi:hypothetical protein
LAKGQQKNDGMGSKNQNPVRCKKQNRIFIQKKIKKMKKEILK